MADVVAEWTPAQVAAWITTKLDMPLLAGRLRKMGVTGKKLLMLDSFSGNRLLRTTYEVSVLGDRLRILDEIQKLRDQAIERDSNLRWAQTDSTPAPNEHTPSGSQSIADALGRKKKIKEERDVDNSLGTIAPWRANAFPPMGFVDPAEAGRVEPAAGLELEFVYGYRGYDRRGNLFYNLSGELVYSISKLGVVFNLESRSQRFFTTHENDVACLTLHAEGVLVASGEAGKRGVVLVWDSQSMEHVQTLERQHRGTDATAQHGIQCVAFVADADRLVTIGDDMTILVWDWPNQSILAEVSAGTGSVFAARVNPYQRSSVLLVTAGTACVRFWTLREKTATLEGRWGVVRELGTSQSALCIDFLDKTTTVTGMQDGSIYVWQGFSVAKSIENAHGGAVFDVCVGSNFLLSGGHDGKIHKWSLGTKKKQGTVERTVLLLAASVDTYEVLSKLDEALESEADGGGSEHGEGEQRHGEKKKKQGYWDKHTPCVRSLAVLQDAEDDANRNINIAFGLESNQIMQLETGPALTATQGVCQVVLNGHAADAIYGLALHPQHPIMCTTGADESIRLWDLRSKRLLAQHRPQQLPGDFGTTPKDNTALLATCCDFSPKHPHHLAVGLDDGTVMAFAYEGSMLGVVHRERVLTSRVTCVRFSPGGEKLAVAHRASSIVLLTTTGGEGGVVYKPLRTLSVSLGGYAIALDWSEGGSGGNGDKALYLQGTTNILDLLFWEVDNGRQLRVTSEMRDVSWSTYNCPVGWPLLGLFSGGKHAHEVSCVDRVGKDLVVAGSKEGNVLMSRFPSLDKTRLKATAAHVGQVVGVRSVSMGGVGGGKQTLVVSVGADLSVIQWRLKRQSKGRALTRVADTIEDPLLKMLLEPWPVAQTLREIVPPSNELHWRNRMALPAPAAVSRAKGPDLNQLTLRLDMVHGYSGQFARGNIFCSDEGELIYPVGRVVVVLDVDKQQQKFYTRHTAPVACMTACDVPQDVLLRFISETHGAPPEGLRANESLVASAQAGKPSFVHVWDAGSMMRHAKLEVDIHIWRIAFAGDDRSLLAMVGGEKAPVSIAVWEWLNGTPLAEVASDKGPIMDLCCNPFFDRQSLDAAQVPWAVTCHAGEVSFWTFSCNQSRGSYLSHTGTLLVQDAVLRHPGEEATQPAAMCAELLNSELMLTGMSDGDILVWKGSKTVSRVRRVHVGGVLAIAYAQLADDVVTGGEDGAIKVWQGSTIASAQPNLRRIITGVSRHGEAAVRAICAGRGNLRGRAAIGLSVNEIKEVVLKESTVARNVTHSHVLSVPQDGAERIEGIHGQWGAMAVCAHPSEEKYVTAGLDGHVRVWEIGRERKGIDRRLDVGLLCCCFSGDGLEVAVGSDNGRVWILLAANLSRIAEFHSSGLSAITAVSFAPDGSAVAIGGLSSKRGLTRAGVKIEALSQRRKGAHDGGGGWSEMKGLRCEGRVLRIDWSSDGAYLQVSTEAGEMAYLARDGTVLDAGSGSAWEELRGAMIGPAMGWETWTAPVGWAVQGVLGQTGGEVSAVDRGFKHSMLVAGRRDGSVQLLPFPSDEAVPELDRSKLVKHAGSVWGVCFVGGRGRDAKGLVKPGRIVSVGVGDAAVYQWLLVDEGKAATDMQRLVRGNRARKAAEKKRRDVEEQERLAREHAQARRDEHPSAQAGARDSHSRAESPAGTAHRPAGGSGGMEQMLETMEGQHGVLLAALRRGPSEPGGEQEERLRAEMRRLLEAQQRLLESLGLNPNQS